MPWRRHKQNRIWVSAASHRCGNSVSTCLSQDQLPTGSPARFTIRGAGYREPDIRLRPALLQQYILFF